MISGGARTEPALRSRAAGRSAPLAGPSKRAVISNPRRRWDCPRAVCNACCFAQPIHMSSYRGSCAAAICPGLPVPCHQQGFIRCWCPVEDERQSRISISSHTTYAAGPDRWSFSRDLNALSFSLPEAPAAGLPHRRRDEQRAGTLILPGRRTDLPVHARSAARRPDCGKLLEICAATLQIVYLLPGLANAKCPHALPETNLASAPSLITQV